MSTMFSIAVYNEAGRIQEVFKCDGRCYRRNGARRDCICGGHNAGLGKAAAVENTNEWVEVWYQEFMDKHKADYPDGYFFYLTFQLVLVHFPKIPITPV